MYRLVEFKHTVLREYTVKNVWDLHQGHIKLIKSDSKDIYNLYFKLTLFFLTFYSILKDMNLSFHKSGNNQKCLNDF